MPQTKLTPSVSIQTRYSLFILHMTYFPTTDKSTLDSLATDKLIVLGFEIEVTFRNVGFWGTFKDKVFEEEGEPKKILGAMMKTNQKFDPRMGSTLRFETLAHGCEASAHIRGHLCPTVICKSAILAYNAITWSIIGRLLWNFATKMVLWRSAYGKDKILFLCYMRYG